MIATSYRLFSLIASMLLTVLSMHIQAEQVTNSVIAISQLNFKHKFQTVHRVDSMEIEQVLGEVSFKPKSVSKYNCLLHRNKYLLYNPGVKVGKGQKVQNRRVQVNHFLEEIDASKSILLK